MSDHLRDVAGMAGKFGDPLGLGVWAHVAGLLHDIGKASDAYQSYIRGKGSSPDHSTAGAREAVQQFGLPGRFLAFAIAGHHAGLADGKMLNERLCKKLEKYTGWEAYTGALPALTSLADKRRNPEKNFSQAFFVRMLFSCLVDADFLATEAFYSPGATLKRDGFSAISTLQTRLARFMAGITKDQALGLNGLRHQILTHAVARAELPPGLFTMTVPTGGGKTLASLSFALRHAVKHGLCRVIYVAPYTSIIDQTAQVFKNALGDEDVLEHHSGLDWEEAEKEGDPDGVQKLRNATENWVSPIIVTTAVQFFESLFAAKPSACRKLHNMARSVIVLDEAQTLPLPVLRPCLAALEELTLNYGASVVLCTATQPAWRRQDGALPSIKGSRQLGLDIPQSRELAPDPVGLFAALKRVRVEVLPSPVTDADIAARFAEQERMLCIVNSRAHAKSLFDEIAALPGARHLTTLMCAAHRSEVLTQIREDLADQRPVRLVATSLIEAGVDIDFAEVWRARTGLDSIAQAAGRCNREGKQAGLGRVVVFTPAARQAPKAFRAFAQAAEGALNMPDPLGLDAVHRYFRELYFNRGAERLDALMIDGLPGVLKAISDADLPFASIAEAFKLIDETMRGVIVNWQGRVTEALAALRAAPVPPRNVMRKLQLFTVPVPEAMWKVLRASGGIQPIRPEDYGERFMLVENSRLYDDTTGLLTSDEGVLIF
ncbi:CRISPR-associated endonuclease Cas3'' [Acidocella sp. MX-AZ03]|uniref:CRISPR-associated endonuclease Cas3'' n=1 Tax=Acidocella sp. MX-AZ03 TaxID=2697363 RepID=UPI0022DDD66C|nr:CRISPR-associated endonuclease Cas3'' [Acidocella sp. MX-AZ03]WBO57771.1 CRISPR-associated endonuclease Cas3'' [Acidocella sp. MX-AZ03]